MCMMCSHVLRVRGLGAESTRGNWGTPRMHVARRAGASRRVCMCMQRAPRTPDAPRDPEKATWRNQAWQRGHRRNAGTAPAVVPSTSQDALARQLGSPARPACQDARPRGRCSQPTRSARHGQFARGTARGALLGAMLYSRRARTAQRMLDADTSRELWADGDGMRERLAATGC